MPSEYPNGPAKYEAEGEDDDRDVEQGGSEVEEAEPEDWTELYALDELDDIEDGPSTYFVGGFSTCARLSSAVQRARYRQDRILVFPGAYTEAVPPRTAGTQGEFEPGSEKDELVLDEARLAGLRIEGVPYAIGTSAYVAERDRAARRRNGRSNTSATLSESPLAARAAMRALLADREPATGRRVGPWVTYALGAVSATSNGSGGGASATTSMGSSVYGPRVTPTLVSPTECPVISSRLVVRTAEVAGGAATGDAADALPTLRTYEPMSDPDDAEEEGGSEENDDGDENEGRELGGAAAARRRRDNADRGSESEEDEPRVQGMRNAAAEASGVRLRGLCFTGGLILEPLTAAQLSHCVFGTPSALHTDAHTGKAVTRPKTMVTAHPLSDAHLTRCLIYGGTSYGVYAYPRSAVVLKSCLIEGPSPSAFAVAVTSRGRAARHIPSALAVLEAKARARNVAAATGSSTGGAVAAAAAAAMDSIDEAGFTSFIVPAARTTACDVGVFCDDADLTLTDCMLSNTRLGLLLHGACTGTRVIASDIRCVEEVGVYMYGAAGSATIAQSVVRRCGRECLLIAGPTEAQVAEAEAKFRAEHPYMAEESSDGEEGDEDGEGDDDATETKYDSRRPVFAQHPRVRNCLLAGAVRTQGDVRDGACVDNLVFAPSRTPAGNGAAAESAATTAATEAEELASLIQGPSYGVTKAFPLRGFTVAGREGVQRKATATTDNRNT